MQLNNWISLNTSLTWSQIFDPDTGAVQLRNQNGSTTIVAWNASSLGLAQPGPTLLTQIAAMPEAYSREVLIANLYAAQAAALATTVSIALTPTASTALSQINSGSITTISQITAIVWPV